MFNPSYRPAIYSGSKIWHNTKWLDMRDNYGFNVNARWINFPCGEKNDNTLAVQFTDKEKQVLWQECLVDVANCDMAIFYGENDEQQRGALVEFGMAIMAGKPTYVIGDCPSFVPVNHSDAAYMHHTLVKRISVDKFEDGSYDYINGYKLAALHFRENYHTPKRFFERTPFLNVGFTPSLRGLHT